MSGLWLAPASAAPVDINPDVSDNTNPNAATGGRVNHMAAVPGDNQTFYVASEYGGLFKSTDGGATWAHLDRHVPVMTWDVEVDPGNTDRVYATSWYDGRVNSLSGISVSTDAGANWTKSAASNPPAGWSCNNPVDEPTAYGISIAPDDSAVVGIGTSCGLALSTNSGGSWTYIDPSPGNAADHVWDVNIQAGGLIDVCGQDGHFRSTDSGANWTAGGFVPGGRCTIAASPDESYVLFIYASDNNVYESDDAGATWTNLGSPQRQGRVPFVVTNQRSDTAGPTDVFDLWAGDVQLFRASCTTPNPPAQGGTNRCPAAASWTNAQNGAHWDGGDLLFDSEAAVDACPVLYSSDGGIQTNTVATSPGCHTPVWQRSNVGMHALYLWSFDGADAAGAGSEGLYMGAQDTGTFATLTAPANPPTWTNPNCCDTFDIVANDDWVLGTVCCFNTGRFNRLELAGPNYAGQAEVNTYPPGNIPTFDFGPRIASFGADDVVVITNQSPFVYVTNDIQANPIVWTGLAAPPAQPCGVKVSTDGTDPVFYAQVGQCTARGNDQLYRYTGTSNTGTWTRVDNTDGLVGGRVGIFGVDPTDSDDLYISYLGGAAPQMMESNDGGTTWTNDPELDALLTGNGVFKPFNSSGAANQAGGASPRQIGYPQASLVAYDPSSPNTLIAGGVDSGVFVSFDGGDNWALASDPFTPGSAPGRVHVPRPRFAYFDDDGTADTSVYVGTQGRGSFRLTFNLPTADAGGPYSTSEGTDVALDATASASDPAGQPLTYQWDLDDDGEFDDATGATPNFTTVGRDGSFPVRVKVTDPDGAHAVASSTVTVDNVAPTLLAVADTGPVDENTEITVTGTVSDPGWLDPLSATIDWGDGTPVETVSTGGESVRPDATLPFSLSHTYGDNGTFTAEVCGVDDDTSTCLNLSLVVDNVNPIAVIDASGATDVNGTPTVIAEAGAPVPFSGQSTDPGSDDLTLTWQWGDGTPDTATTYLVNPPLPDPAQSPSVQPRDVTDDQIHTFGEACMYVTTFGSEDDDSGSASQSIDVLITGNADTGRSQGWWQTELQRVGKTTFTDARLECYLAIVDHVSEVFHEATDASTIQKAYAVMLLGRSHGSATERFDRALLTLWLNFANGAVGYDELVDTDRDEVPDTPLSVAVAGAEAVRLAPASTAKEIEEKRHLLLYISTQV